MRTLRNIQSIAGFTVLVKVSVHVSTRKQLDQNVTLHFKGKNPDWAQTISRIVSYSPKQKTSWWFFGSMTEVEGFVHLVRTSIKQIFEKSLHTESKKWWWWCWNYLLCFFRVWRTFYIIKTINSLPEKPEGECQFVTSGWFQIRRSEATTNWQGQKKKNMLEWLSSYLSLKLNEMLWHNLFENLRQNKTILQSRLC